LKLQVQVQSDSNTFTGYGDGYIEINRVRHRGSLILAGEGPVLPWNAPSFDALQPEHFAPVLALRPQIVLIGTGPGHRFAGAALLRPLVEHGVGFEFMDTLAACRTFNILIGEGRSVVAALLVPKEDRT
jgi:uncharacterized protein